MLQSAEELELKLSSHLSLLENITKLLEYIEVFDIEEFIDMEKLTKHLDVLISKSFN